MAMPVELYIGRHGESERNFANHALINEELDYFTREFLERPSGVARLTPLGCKQALAAGEWLREQGGLAEGDGYFVSSFVRAIETALLLDLPQAQWHRRNELRERNAGDWEHLSAKERMRLIEQQPVKLYELDPWNWSSPNGESFADISIRLWIFLHMLHERYAQKRVILVCHGYVMLALRVLLERMSDEKFRQVYRSKDSNERTHNGLILHYSRTLPDGSTTPDYQRMRRICPWNPSLVSSEWETIEKRSLSNEDLRRIVDAHPQMIRQAS